MRYCVGVFGGMASGKSTVMSILKGLGATVFSADEENAGLLKEAWYIRRIYALCPQAVRSDAVDRQALRTWMLESTEHQLALQSLAHPAIKARLMEKTKGRLSFVELSVYVPDFLPLDDSWWVASTEGAQLARVIERGFDEDTAGHMIALQRQNGEHPHGATTIVNNGTKDELEAKVTALYQSVRRLYK